MFQEILNGFINVYRPNKAKNAVKKMITKTSFDRFSGMVR